MPDSPVERGLARYTSRRKYGLRFALRPYHGLYLTITEGLGFETWTESWSLRGKICSRYVSMLALSLLPFLLPFLLLFLQPFLRQSMLVPMLNP